MLGGYGDKIIVTEETHNDVIFYRMKMVECHVLGIKKRYKDIDEFQVIAANKLKSELQKVISQLSRIK